MAISSFAPMALNVIANDMPLTPFHFGPAAFLKALFPRKFSFLVFCYSQIVIDLEVAYRIVRQEFPIHGVSHTYVGALVLGLFCGVTALPLHKVAVKFASRSAYYSLILNPLSLRVAFVSSFLGTLSHVFFDSIMHFDMKPLSPFGDYNALLGILDLDILHLFCVVSGIIGLIWCGIISKRV